VHASRWIFRCYKTDVVSDILQNIIDDIYVLLIVNGSIPVFV